MLDGERQFFGDLFMRDDLGKFDVLKVVGETLGVGRFPGLNEYGGGVFEGEGSEGLGVHLG